MGSFMVELQPEMHTVFLAAFIVLPFHGHALQNVYITSGHTDPLATLPECTSTVPVYASRQFGLNVKANAENI